MTSATPDQPLSGTPAESGRGGPEAGAAGNEPPRPARDGLGQVLRDAYRDALNEAVPDDMLDLLRKLD